MRILPASENCSMSKTWTFNGQLLIDHRAVQRRTLLFSGLLICGGSAAAFGLVTLVHNPHVFLAICLLLRVVNGVGAAAVDTSSFSMISGCRSCTLATPPCLILFTLATLMTSVS